jgi:Protein of unknown function (DUF1524)
VANVLVVVLLVAAGYLAIRNAERDPDGPSPPADESEQSERAEAREQPEPTERPNRPDRPDRPAEELLATLTVARERGGARYERSAFGDGWQLGGDGCDTRDEVLAEESRVPARLGRDGCTVVEGRWLSLYDGDTTTDPGDLQIDHVVPLAEAWASGASEWPPERRERFANDTRRTGALLAVTSSTNQSKGDQDPAEWMPPERDAWCRYANAWVTQKAAWRLTVDRAERDALREVLAAC